MKDKDQVYLTNDIFQLKKQGILNRDIELLSKIKAFETEEKNRLCYYSRMSEDVIRDSEGVIIDPETLPVRRWTIFEYYCPMQMVIINMSIEEKPGRLYDLIVNDAPNHPLPILVREMPDDTTFPLEPNFNWFRYIEEWLKVNPYTYDMSSRHRLNGNDFYKLFPENQKVNSEDGLTLISDANLLPKDISELKELMGIGEDE